MLKTCWYCHRQLSILKSLSGDLFCSKKHEELYLSKESALAFERLKDPGFRPPAVSPAAGPPSPVKLPPPIQPEISRGPDLRPNDFAKNEPPPEPWKDAARIKELWKDESPANDRQAVAPDSDEDRPLPVAPYFPSPPTPVVGDFRALVPEEALPYLLHPIHPSRIAVSQVAFSSAGPLHLPLRTASPSEEQERLIEPAPIFETLVANVPVLDLRLADFDLEPESGQPESTKPESTKQGHAAPAPAGFVSPWDRQQPFNYDVPAVSSGRPAFVSQSPVFSLDLELDPGTDAIRTIPAAANFVSSWEQPAADCDAPACDSAPPALTSPSPVYFYNVPPENLRTKTFTSGPVYGYQSVGVDSVPGHPPVTGNDSEATPASPWVSMAGSNRNLKQFSAAPTPKSYRQASYLSISESPVAAFPCELNWSDPAARLAIQRLVRRAAVEKRSTHYRRVLRGPTAPPYMGAVEQVPFTMTWSERTPPTPIPSSGRMPVSSATTIGLRPLSALRFRRQVSVMSSAEWGSDSSFTVECIKPRAWAYVQSVSPVHQIGMRAAEPTSLLPRTSELPPPLGLLPRATVNPRLRLPEFDEGQTAWAPPFLAAGGYLRQVSFAPISGTVQFPPPLPALSTKPTYGRLSKIGGPKRRLAFAARPCGFLVCDTSTAVFEFAPNVKTQEWINHGEMPVSQPPAALQRQQRLNSSYLPALNFNAQIAPLHSPRVASAASLVTWPGVPAPTLPAVINIVLPASEPARKHVVMSVPRPNLPAPAPVQPPAILAPLPPTGTLVNYQFAGPIGFMTGAFLTIVDEPASRALNANPLQALQPARIPGVGRTRPRPPHIRPFALGTFAKSSASTLHW